ncbi:MAG: ion channel [Actinomycetota bacterium]
MSNLGEFVARNPKRPHRVFRRRVVTGLVLVAAADAVGSVLMYVFEQGAEGGKINAFTDALFFSTVQLLTISSQMPNPVTGPGRIVDVALELVGISFVAALAGAFASFFLHVGAERVD